MHKWLVATAVVAVSVVMLSAAAAGGAAAKPTLTIGGANICGDQTPLAYGPMWRWDFVYESPIIERADGTFAPGLAASWHISPGNKSITLTLRRNARFSDGTSVDAAALKSWLDWRASQAAWTNSAIGSFRSAEVVSKWVVRLTLKSPNPVLLYALSTTFSSDWGHVVSPRAIAQVKADPKGTLLSRQTFGAGPYVYAPSQSLEGDHCTYVPNKYYYDKSRQVWGKIVFRSVSDPNTALAALKTGQIDVAWSLPFSTVGAARTAGFKVVVTRLGSVGLYYLDLGGKLAPPLADVRVRRALNYAVDRKAIAMALYGPDAIPTSNMDAGSDGDDPSFSMYYSYNPAKARALLAAAGYSNGFTFKVLTIGAWAGPGYDYTPLAYAAAKYFAAVGVTMQVVDVANGSEFGQALNSRIYPVMTDSWQSIPMWDFYSYQLERGSQWGDQHGWHDPMIDKLWLKGQRLGLTAAAKVWRQMGTRTVTQAYAVPIASQPTYLFVSGKVGGIAASGAGTFNAEFDWYPTGK
jgi:peptide/nickel transport system substrate-binding protein